MSSTTGVKAQVGVEAVELRALLASRCSFMRARPEAALRVGAAVVEAMMRGIVGRVGDLALEPAVAVDEPDAVAQRDDEAAAHAQREAADRLPASATRCWRRSPDRSD